MFWINLQSISTKGNKEDDFCEFQAMGVTDLIKTYPQSRPTESTRRQTPTQGS